MKSMVDGFSDAVLSGLGLDQYPSVTLIVNDGCPMPCGLHLPVTKEIFVAAAPTYFETVNPISAELNNLSLDFAVLHEIGHAYDDSTSGPFELRLNTSEAASSFGKNVQGQLPQGYTGYWNFDEL